MCDSKLNYAKESTNKRDRNWLALGYWIKIKPVQSELNCTGCLCLFVKTIDIVISLNITSLYVLIVAWQYNSRMAFRWLEVFYIDHLRLIGFGVEYFTLDLIQLTITFSVIFKW